MLGFPTPTPASRGRIDQEQLGPCHDHAAGRRDPPQPRSSWPSCWPPAARRSRRSRPRAPTRQPAAPQTPSRARGRSSPTAYPPSGDAPCGQAKAPDATHAAYRGDLKRIVAKDAYDGRLRAVRPDVAFLAKIASPAFAINDTDWLRSHIVGERQRRPGRSSARSTAPDRTGSRRGTAARRSASPATTPTGARPPRTNG